MQKDYYKVLGVDRNASPEEIKRAFRRLAHQYHPDKGTGDEAKFKEINEAYQVLSDKEKRARYDQFGSAEGPAGFGGFEGFGGFNGNVGFEDLGDFVSSMFGGGFGGFGGQARESTGADIELELRLTLEDVFKGVDHAVEISTQVGCTVCKGTGAEPGTEIDTCSSCNGKGQVREMRNVLFAQVATMAPCRACDATGKVPKTPCAHCKGSGRMKGTRKFTVHVPAGVRDKQIVKVAGQGEAGKRGKRDGDAYIHIRVVPHKVFVRHEDDLIVTTELHIADLLLGNELSVPTITGTHYSFVIPHGTNLKEPYRIRGEGMPHMSGRGRGDLLVVFEFKAPKAASGKTNEKLKELLE